MALDFETQLRREEALRQTEGIPEGARRAIWERVEQSVERRQRRSRPARAVVFAVAASALAAGLAIVALRGPSHLGEFQVARESEDLSARVRGGLVEIERGGATLIDPPSGVVLETVGPVALRREPSGVRVVRGRTNVRVEHRAPHASPAIILVSHGAIEVTGTAFTVVQGQSGGSVLLHEGRIRFRGVDAVSVNLRPGDELAWPLPAPRQPLLPAPPSTVSPSAAAPSSAAPAAPRPALPLPSATPAAHGSAAPVASGSSTEELLDRVEALRSRHQFEAAARELSRGIPTQPRAMRERLSFELGSLLTHQIRDARRACAHWAAHERSFRGGRYRDEVARSQRALKCEPVAP
jgi:transmembrane sensor